MRFAWNSRNDVPVTVTREKFHSNPPVSADSRSCPARTPTNQDRRIEAGVTMAFVTAKSSPGIL
jgi:hypothetical protein